uniref:Uncharacterized protein n=1 Tax=Anguilla anguilla TaxID=7936 RepID=A0A0E9RTH2_ANGAN
MKRMFTLGLVSLPSSHGNARFKLGTGRVGWGGLGVSSSDRD